MALHNRSSNAIWSAPIVGAVKVVFLVGLMILIPPSKPNIPKPDINATAAMAVRINPAGRKK